MLVADYILDQPFDGCMYCKNQNKSCIFHQKNKKHLGSQFWTAIRTLKPNSYRGFIFPEMESYKFLDDKQTLSEDANFWSANEKVIFTDVAVFENCTFENFIFNHTLFLKEIIFIKCTIKSMTFLHCIFANEHPIRFEFNASEKLAFENCQVSNKNHKYKLEFINNEFKFIDIYNCTFDSYVHIAHQQKFDISISENSKITYLNIHNCEIKTFRSFKSNIDDFSLNSNKIEKLQYLLNKSKNVYLYYIDTDNIIIQSRIDNTVIENTFIKESFVYESLEINNASLSIYALTLAKESVFTVQDTNFSYLKLRHFYRLTDQVFFSNLSIHELFEIRQSNLSKVQFNSLSFDSNCRVDIYQSNVGECIFNNVEWNNIAVINADKDTFRQLKNANDKQSNFITAHQFYAREMDEYSKVISEKSFEEKIVFVLGKYISNFSQSWTMPLCWTIIVGLVMYLLTISSLEFIFIVSMLTIPILFIFFPKNSIDHNNFSTYLYTVTALFFVFFILVSSNFNGLASFINPFGSFLKENPEKYYFVWLLHKIISSFTVYHFVIALRRATQR